MSKKWVIFIELPDQKTWDWNSWKHKTRYKNYIVPLCSYFELIKSMWKLKS